MPKTTLVDIFKSGDAFKLKEVDFSSREMQQEMKETRRQISESKAFAKRAKTWPIKPTLFPLSLPI